LAWSVAWPTRGNAGTPGSGIGWLRLQLAAVGAVGLGLSAVAAALTAANVAPEWAAVAAAARASMVAVPIAVGLYAWYRRPADRFGRLLVAAGFGWFLTTLAESGNGVLYSVGRVSGWVVQIALMWLMLAFPSGRLTNGSDRALVWAGVALLSFFYLSTALFAESYPVPSPYTSCTAGCPENAFMVLGSEPSVVGSLVVPVREVLTVLLFFAVPARLVQRLRRASSLMRRTLAPVLTVAVAQLVILAIAIALRRVTPGSPAVEAFAWMIALAVPALALGFFVGLLQRRLYVADALQQLALRVRGKLTRDELRAALSEAVDDPSLELVFWVNGRGSRWVDAEGRSVKAPGPASGRCLTEVRDGDRLVAGIAHDAALLDQPDFVHAVAAHALTALESRRLAAKVESSLREVRESRARLLASADRERRRIERDLHDGAQQRLVALRVQLELAEELTASDPAEGRRKLHTLGEEVTATLDEIRDLARGVYPALLADRGLSEALRAAARRLPVAATVDADGVGRHPPEVESAVYFCCLEAMQNASKHAREAHAVAITLVQDAALRFEVRDDGAGFDTTVVQRGEGLMNMRDRLAAVGGEIKIRSAPGRGTVVTGAVPLDRASGGIGEGEPEEIPHTTAADPS
jgi:signal transduction histidine kinase